MWLVSLIASLAVLPSMAQEPAAPMTIVGEFSNMRFTEEHAYGYMVQFWRHGKDFAGLLLSSEGLQGDTPTGLLENVHFDLRSGKVSFTANLTTDMAVMENGRQEPTRDYFEFQGILRKDSLSGVLKRSDHLRHGTTPISKQLVLKKQTASGMTEPSSYAEWKKETDEILEYRGPKW
ncbi:MAG: hypothetical protein ABIZ80_25865 [Bryobacteraceae bacterium]